MANMSQSTDYKGEKTLTNTDKLRYNKDEILDSNVTKAINDILSNGNDAVIRRKGNGIIVLEDSRKTKLDTSVIGRK